MSGLVAQTEQACPCCGQPVFGHASIETLKGLRVSWQRRRILEALAANFGKWVHVEKIVSAVWWDDPNGGPERAVNHISVQVHRLKKQLAGSGFRLESMSGKGGGRRLVWQEPEQAENLVPELRWLRRDGAAA